QTVEYKQYPATAHDVLVKEERLQIHEPTDRLGNEPRVKPDESRTVQRDFAQVIQVGGSVVERREAGTFEFTMSPHQADKFRILFYQAVYCVGDFKFNALDRLIDFFLGRRGLVAL